MVVEKVGSVLASDNEEKEHVEGRRLVPLKVQAEAVGNVVGAEGANMFVPCGSIRRVQALLLQQTCVSYQIKMKFGGTYTKIDDAEGFLEGRERRCMVWEVRGLAPASSGDNALELLFSQGTGRL